MANCKEFEDAHEKDKKRMNLNEVMALLFAEAEAKGLWFKHDETDAWYSPQELRELQTGRMGYKYIGWELRDPKEKIEQMKTEIKNMTLKLAEFRARFRK